MTVEQMISKFGKTNDLTDLGIDLYHILVAFEDPTSDEAVNFALNKIDATKEEIDSFISQNGEELIKEQNEFITSFAEFLITQPISMKPWMVNKATIREKEIMKMRKEKEEKRKKIYEEIDELDKRIDDARNSNNQSLLKTYETFKKSLMKEIHKL